MRDGIVVVVGLLCLPGVALAGDVQHHQERQDKRIEKGVESGSLTPEEKSKLDAKEGAIQKERDEAAADGKVTKGEHASIRHEQKEAHREIKHMKHNRQKTTPEPTK
jgi:hypothetical protein